MNFYLATCAAVSLLSSHPLDLRTSDEVKLGGHDYVRIEGRANEYRPSGQSNASLTAVPNGGFAIAWDSKRQLDGNSGVYLRSFNNLGAPIAQDESATKDKYYPQARPSVALTANGKPLAFYETYFRDASELGIFAGERGVNQKFLGDQSDVVTASTKNRIVAAWVSQINGKKRRVFARVFAGSGKPTGNEFRVSDAKTGTEVVPSIAISGSNVYVAWQRFDDNSRPAGIFARRFGIDGKPLGSSAQVAPATALEPNLSSSGRGLFLAWNESKGTSGDFVAKAQILDASLKPITGVIFAAKQVGSQNAAAIAGHGDGSFAIAWNLSNRKRKDVYLQLFSASGKSITQALRVNSVTSGEHGMAESTGKTRLLYDAGGAITVAWSGSDNEDEEGGSAYFTRFMPKESVTESQQTELRSITSATEAKLDDEKSATQSKTIAMVREGASPHEPPRFNPFYKRVWDVPGNPGDETGFLGINGAPWTPPDPHMAVGPTNVVVMTNGAIAFFNKDGTRTFIQPIENSFGFWGSLGTENFTFDPEVIYDAQSGRFMAMACERASNGSNFLLAVSDDSDPNGVWFKYRINVTALAGSDIDSPNIAVDNQAIYLSADFFTPNQKYLVYMIRKSDVLSGGVPVTTNMLITGTQSFGIPMTLDPGAVAQYMIEHFEAGSNTTVRLHAIQNALTAPTRTTFTLTVPAYGPPESPPQAGTTSRPNTFDSRFWSCVYRDGYFWATHHVNSTNVRARWYQIRMNNWPNSGMNPELVQSGEVTPGAGIRTFFSSINVDGAGNAAIVCARSSPSEFISFFRAARNAGDPPGTMNDTAIMKNTLGPYNSGRWGDYSGCSVDPADDRTFWGHHEFAENGSWRTWIAPFRPIPGEEIAPSNMAIVRGIVLSGGLPSLVSSDDVRLSTRPGVVLSSSEAPVQLLFEGTCPVSTITALHFILETNSNSTSIEQKLELFNFQTSSYEIADVRMMTTTDMVADYSASGDLSRFIEPGTNLMRAKLSCRAVAPVLTYPWTANIDHLVWKITR